MIRKNDVTIITERGYRKDHTVSYDTVLGMEDAFVNEGVKMVNLKPVFHVINNALNWRLKLRKIQFADKSIKIEKDGYYLYIAMSYRDMYNQTETLRRVTKKGGRVLIYCFDTWEKRYDDWENVFKRIDPYMVFFAYKRSMLYFSSRLERVGFVPQSMDEKYFYPRDIDKKRAFIQIGRKNAKIHNRILKYMKDRKMSDDQYVYEKIPGKIIYPETMDLVKGLCASYFSVCAPQSAENAALTGNVSDVTARFYESIACKTLIIGFKPETFDEIFPADTMVELSPDRDDLAEKIQKYLDDPKLYKEKVEANYDYLMKHHRWKNRLEQIIEYIG